MEKKKIVIIGAGIYGCSIFLKLKKTFDCIILEKNNEFLNGATSNNLNRIHFGYHYPRDQKTVDLCLQGYKTFKKLYSNSIIDNFKNYYSISKDSYSKTNTKNYLNFLKKNKLFFNKKNLSFANNDLLDIFNVNEPIYDVIALKKIIKKKINKKSVFFNQKVKKIKKKKKIYEILTNKNNIYKADIIIDTTHYATNNILTYKNKTKLNYQLTCIYEIKLKSVKKLGFAVMDGPYFSILPLGRKKDVHLLYDVEHSILKQKNSFQLPENFLNFKTLQKTINKNKIKIKNKVKRFLPDLKFSYTAKSNLAIRVFLPKWKKNDSRVPQIIVPKKNYYQILSTKVDHAVTISDKLVKMLSN